MKCFGVTRESAIPNLHPSIPNLEPQVTESRHAHRLLSSSSCGEAIRQSTKGTTKEPVGI